jgi:hypothetical protein
MNGIMFLALKNRMKCPDNDSIDAAATRVKCAEKVGRHL